MFVDCQLKSFETLDKYIHEYFKSRQARSLGSLVRHFVVLEASFLHHQNNNGKAVAKLTYFLKVP